MKTFLHLLACTYPCNSTYPYISSSSFTMFLSQKKKDTKKGLNSIKIDSLTAPSHCTPADLLPASLQYRPVTKIPTRGATELTKDDRHRNHLRKKRVLKVEKKRKDAEMRVKAQSNKKLRSKIEKEDALKKLNKNKNVQIIGSGGKNFKAHSTKKPGI